MKKIVLWMLLAALLVTQAGCSQQKISTGTELTLWTTSQSYAAGYEALAQAWNEEYPDRQICLNIQVYSLQRITQKLSSAFYSGSRFGNETIPDLMDIDYSFFWNYLSDHKTELYPLENILKNNNVSQSVRYNAGMYSSNQICFALPYSHQQLLLCYRLDLTETYRRLTSYFNSFEALTNLGSQMFRLSGQSLIEADYLGKELFLSLFLRALDSQENTEEAYQIAVAQLKQMHQSGAARYLTSGDAYGDAFGGLLESGQLHCFITTAANLSALAEVYPEAAQRYGITALPGFQAVQKDVTLPAMATAVYLSSKQVILARDFLEFCRFSEASAQWPLLYLGGEEDMNAILSGYGKLSKDLSWGTNVDLVPLSLLAQKIPSYSQDVLTPDP